MMRTLAVFIAALTYALAAAPAGAAPVPAEIAQPALRYANACLARDLTVSWNLLSSESRAEMDAVAWEEAFRGARPARTPSANVVLSALATAEAAPDIRGLLLRGDEALVHIGETIRVTRQLVLEKEGEAWLIDLAASDELNARKAGEEFLEAARAQAAAAGRARVPAGSLAMLRALLAPQVEQYRLLEAEIDTDRARVTLVGDVPVNLVLRAVRLGPGWTVDLSRPLLATDPTDESPLEHAAAEADKSACQEQLRKLGRAFQMYLAASQDYFPDPDRWVEQIRPYSGRSEGLHCPADPEAGISYAFNRNLAGLRRTDLARPAQVPMVYESDLRGPNPAGVGERWPSPPRHPGGNLVLFADGSVRTVPMKPNFEAQTGEASSEERSARTPSRPLERPRPRPQAP